MTKDNQITAFISVGSNLDKPIDYCRFALKVLSDNQDINISVFSSLYLTEPVSSIEQNWFYNFVVKVKTSLSAFELLDFCQKTENECGRERIQKNAPRTLDLDIVYYGKEIINTERLKVPHPMLAQRKFVLIPLTEIMPEWLDPVTNRSALKTLRKCEDKHAILLYDKHWFHLNKQV